MSRTSYLLTIGAALVGVLLAAAVFAAVYVPVFVTERQDPPPLQIDDGSSIVLVGNNLCSRMMSYGHFETEVFLRYPNAHLTIRNMCDPGNTPGFRPHAGRTSAWAFPGAEAFYTELARESGSEGNFDTPDGWLAQLEADVIVAFFGYNESFRGADEPEAIRDELDTYRDELDAFVNHTLDQRYSGDGPPQLALVSPIAFENLSDRYDLPDGERENARLARYTEVMREVAERHNVPFVDAFSSTRTWYAAAEEPLTVDGFQMGESGYARLAALLADRVVGGSASEGEAHRSAVRDAVLEKNWYWQKDFKMPSAGSSVR